MMKKVLLPIAALVLVAACSKDSKKIDPPAALVDYTAQLTIEKLWSESLGGKEKRLRLGLSPSVDGAQVFAASHNGDVLALDVLSGREHWHIRTKRPLSAGPGVGSGVVVVGSEKGDVIALKEETGAQLWRVKVGGEVLSAPAVGANVVVVRTVDGRLKGLAPTDGHELWSVDQQVPRLSLRGTAPPVLVGDTVICGFDNGKVVAVNATQGDVLWESAVAPDRKSTRLNSSHG